MVLPRLSGNDHLRLIFKYHRGRGTVTDGGNCNKTISFPTHEDIFLKILYVMSKGLSPVFHHHYGMRGTSCSI